MHQDLRLNSIKQWLELLYPAQKIILTAIKGDASFRRYFRVLINGLPVIVMDSPPDKEPLQPFIDSTNRLYNAGIKVPKIYNQNKKLGCLVLDDFGQSDLFSSLGTDMSKQYYQKAINELIKIQTCPNETTLAKFNESHIKNELSLFSDWFINKHCKLENVCLDKSFDILIDNCLQQPYTTIHRDYHSRNLMILEDANIGLIDHQDLMYGPVSYDLVSLLKDCYVDLPPEQVSSLVKYYLANCHYSTENFSYTFELTGVQRHLKAIGIFSRLAHLYNNPNYLQYIPRTLKYIQAVADKEPNLSELSQLIRRL